MSKLTSNTPLFDSSMENLLLKSVPSVGIAGEHLMEDAKSVLKDIGPQAGMAVVKQALPLVAFAMEVADAAFTVCDVSSGACELLL